VNLCGGCIDAEAPPTLKVTLPVMFDTGTGFCNCAALAGTHTLNINTGGDANGCSYIYELSGEWFVEVSINKIGSIGIMQVHVHFSNNNDTCDVQAGENELYWQGTQVDFYNCMSLDVTLSYDEFGSTEDDCEGDGTTVRVWT
jgi:hypothetical protein